MVQEQVDENYPPPRGNKYKSSDPRATATTGYQPPDKCWAPVRGRSMPRRVRTEFPKLEL